jgi:hypothetical protein
MVEAPTAFRANSLQLISPRIVVDLSDVFGECVDLTQNGTSVFGMDVDSINTGLMAGVATPDDMGRYGNNLVQVFRPLSPGSMATVLDVDSLGREGCMAGSPPTCGLDAMAMVLPSRANNSPAGATCYTPMAARVNASTGGAYAPTANTVTGPCYVSDETTYPVNVSGTTLTLRHSQIAAQYQGSPASGLVSGVIVGFLTEADAMSTTLPADLPQVGGMPFYAVLQAGGAPGSACNVDGGTAEDDRDPDPDNPSLQGFWFFLNFTAEVVTWTSM